MVAHRVEHSGRRRRRGQQRVLGERLQVEITPAFALAGRKTGFGKAGEPAPALPGERAGLALRVLLEGVKIGPRLGLYREIDNRVHKTGSPAASSKRP